MSIGRTAFSAAHSGTFIFSFHPIRLSFLAFKIFNNEVLTAYFFTGAHAGLYLYLFVFAGMHIHSYLFSEVLLYFLYRGKIPGGLFGNGLFFLLPFPCFFSYRLEHIL
jgi:hypothetical protein